MKPIAVRSLWLDRVELGAGVVLTAAAVTLHWRQMRAAGGLWRDEVVSLNVATKPTLAELWRYLEFDSFPALFHLVLRAWAYLFGEGDGSLRALGFCVGALFLTSLWMAAKSLGVRVPLLGLALLGLHPMMIRYGDSVRAYGLGCALALLTASMAWKLCNAQRPSWKRVGMCAATGLITVQCLYQNAAILFALLVGVVAAGFYARKRGSASVALFCGLPAAASLIVYLPTIRRAGNWSWILHSDVSNSWLWAQPLAALGSPAAVGAWVWFGLAGIALLIAARRVWRASRERLPADMVRTEIFAAATGIVAVFAYSAFLFYVGHRTQPWCSLPLLAVLALCVDAIFGQPRGSWRWVRIAVAVAFGAYMFPMAWTAVNVRSTNLDLVAARLNAAVGPHDLVLVNQWECAITLAHYYHGDAPLLAVPAISDLSVPRFDLYLQAMQSPAPLVPVFTKVGDTLQSGGRVWLVGPPTARATGEPLPDPPPAGPGARDLRTYRDAWRAIVNEFCRIVALSVAQIPVAGDRPVDANEDFPLSVYQGWVGPVQGPR